MLAFFHIGKDWSLQRKRKTVFQPDEEVWGGLHSLTNGLGTTWLCVFHANTSVKSVVF